MAAYAIGDIQGCFDSLQALLLKIEFDQDKDCLWLLGDLINRGPKSLDVLAFVRELGDSAISVLGNHDLHFLAIYYANHSVRRNDTFDELLNSNEVADYADWLRRQKIFHLDATSGYAMSHAGVPSFWSLGQAQKYAQELEEVLRGENHVAYFKNMYGNTPDLWDEKLNGMDRWRCITNYFTRMRWIDSCGKLEFASKGPLSQQPQGYEPWFLQTRSSPFNPTLLFGHWAALEGVTNDPHHVALDTGCVWGERLTALCLETKTLYSVPAQEI